MTNGDDNNNNTVSNTNNDKLIYIGSILYQTHPKQVNVLLHFHNNLHGWIHHLDFTNEEIGSEKWNYLSTAILSGVGRTSADAVRPQCLCFD